VGNPWKCDQKKVVRDNDKSPKVENRGSVKGGLPRFSVKDCGSVVWGEGQAITENACSMRGSAKPPGKKHKYRVYETDSPALPLVISMWDSVVQLRVWHKFSRGRYEFQETRCQVNEEGRNQQKIWH